MIKQSCVVQIRVKDDTRVVFPEVLIHSRQHSLPQSTDGREPATGASQYFLSKCNNLLNTLSPLAHIATRVNDSIKGCVEQSGLRVFNINFVFHSFYCQ